MWLTTRTSGFEGAFTERRGRGGEYQANQAGVVHNGRMWIGGWAVHFNGALITDLWAWRTAVYPTIMVLNSRMKSWSYLSECGPAKPPVPVAGAVYHDKCLRVVLRRFWAGTARTPPLSLRPCQFFLRPVHGGEGAT